MKFLILASFLLAEVAGGQSIIGLGDEWSAATSVNADGSIVAGYGNSQAFRWVRGSGKQNLGFLPATTTSFARGISGDGSMVVGGSYNSTEGRAFRWSATGGMESLGIFSGDTYSDASRISSDGAFVVGASGNSAFRWSAASGLQNLGLLSGAASSYAHGVNADGTVVVGDSGDQAFRWQVSQGMQSLHGSLGRNVSAAYAVSADGSVVVGEAADSWTSRGETFRWTPSGGAQMLGKLGGDTFSFPNAISADGETIVGQSLLVINSLQNQSRAFVWKASFGMVELGAFLGNEGVDTSGWNFTEAFDISADGRTIVGRGNFNGTSQAFVAQVPEPSSLPLLLAGGAVLMAGRRRK